MKSNNGNFSQIQILSGVTHCYGACILAFCIGVLIFDENFFFIWHYCLIILVTQSDYRNVMLIIGLETMYYFKIN